MFVTQQNMRTLTKGRRKSKLPGTREARNCSRENVSAFTKIKNQNLPMLFASEIAILKDGGSFIGFKYLTITPDSDVF